MWKHKVIRNFVLSQQETVDIVALGQAQRQIQAIVEASLQRKQLGTRAKIARWQNEPSTSPEKDISSQPPTTQPAATTPLPPVLDFELNLDPEKLTAEGWQVSYDLPETKTGGL